MLWLLALIKLLAADSIILDNQCSTSALSDTCLIKLETLKGSPGQDCPLFSTPQRSCLISDEESATTISPSGSTDSLQVTTQQTNHLVSNDGNVTIVTFNASNANGSSQIHGETIWNRPGSVQISTVPKTSLPNVDNLPKVTCICTPTGIQINHLPGKEESLVSALLTSSGSGNQDPQFRRYKRDPKSHDSLKEDDDFESSIAELKKQAENNIKAHINEIETPKSRNRRETNESTVDPFPEDQEDKVEPWHTNDDIPVQTVHDFKEPVTGKSLEPTTVTTNLGSTKMSTNEPMKIEERNETAYERHDGHNDHINHLESHKESSEKKEDHAGESSKEVIDHDHGILEKSKIDKDDENTHQTMNPESTSILPSITKISHKREIESETTTAGGLIDWNLKGPRGRS